MLKDCKDIEMFEHDNDALHDHSNLISKAVQ